MFVLYTSVREHVMGWECELLMLSKPTVANSTLVHDAPSRFLLFVSVPLYTRQNDHVSTGPSRHQLLGGKMWLLPWYISLIQDVGTLGYLVVGRCGLKASFF